MSKRLKMDQAMVPAGGEKEDEEMSSVIFKTNYERNDISAIFDSQRDIAEDWTPQGSFSAAVRVDPVTRQEVANFLRTPAPGTTERECVRGEQCEGRFLLIPPGATPVTLVEHSTPGEKDPQLCILCKRDVCNFMYLNALVEGDSMDQLFTDHCNIVEQPGEYCLDQCLIAGRRATHGVLQPVAIHCRAWYQYAGQKDGITWFTEVHKVFR